MDQKTALEGKFGLTINREKTKIVDLEAPKGQLDFLGFTMRKRSRKECSVEEVLQNPTSKKSLKKAREKIREHTSPRNGFKPIKDIVKRLNLFLRGWGQYFSKGFRSEAFSSINVYTDERVEHFLQRRSQRGYKKDRKSRTWYQEMRRIGVMQLTKQLIRVNAKGKRL